MTGFVYLIECQSGRVKIGCSEDPLYRVEAIARATSYPVRVIAMWPGNIGKERALHHRFSEFRCYREWFEVHGALAEFVSQMRGHGVSSIAAWPVFGGPDAQERERDRRRRQSEALRALAVARRAKAANQQGASA